MDSEVTTNVNQDGTIDVQIMAPKLEIVEESDIYSESQDKENS